MDCLGSCLLFRVMSFCFDRAANARARIAPTSSPLHRSSSALSAEQNNQSTLAWSRQHHLVFYIEALVRVYVTLTQAFALNCRLCLDRSSASESTHTHELRVDTHTTRPFVRGYELQLRANATNASGYSGGVKITPPSTTVSTTAFSETGYSRVEHRLLSLGAPRKRHISSKDRFVENHVSKRSKLLRPRWSRIGVHFQLPYSSTLMQFGPCQL